MDGVSATEAFIVRVNLLSYEGDAGLGRRLPIAGQTALNAEATSTGVGLTFFWRPEWGGIGELWSYAMSATIPLIDMKVSADVETPPGAGRRTDKASDLGDLILMPQMFNYNVNPDFNINMRLTFFAPTGSYEEGRLANTGKNFWSVEPLLGLMYFGQKNGIEASLFGGLTINQENPVTDYKSGNQLHFDGTLAQHFPLMGSFASVGVTGFYYEQVTGDSGGGARFGDFKAKTVGIGPGISCIRKLIGMVKSS